MSIAHVPPMASNSLPSLAPVMARRRIIIAAASLRIANVSQMQWAGTPGVIKDICRTDGGLYFIGSGIRPLEELSMCNDKITT